MTIFLETDLSKLYLTRKPEEKVLEPVTASVPEDDAASDYASQIANEICLLCFGTTYKQQVGESTARQAAQSQARLEKLNELYPICKKDTTCLKQLVCDNTFANSVKFAKDKRDMVNCFRTVDSAHPEKMLQCLAIYAKRLTSTQQEELSKVIPKRLIGQTANAAFAPFALLSQVIKVSMKGLYLAGVSAGCLETDPMHHQQCMKDLRDVFEGRNPEVNAWVEQHLPMWIKTAAQYLAKGDAYLQKFDDYMVDQYYTIPGLMHEGAHGMIDMAIPAAAGGGVRATTALMQASANAAKVASSVMGCALWRYKTPSLSQGRIVSELNLIDKWKLSKPSVEAPVQAKAKLSFEDYTQHIFDLDGGLDKGILLMKQYGDKLLYIHRETFGDKILLSPYVSSPTQRMQMAVEEVFQYADKINVNKVLLAWDHEKFPLATYLSEETIPVHRVGTLPLANSKPLSLVEIDYTP